MMTIVRRAIPVKPGSPIFVYKGKELVGSPSAMVELIDFEGEGRGPASVEEVVA